MISHCIELAPKGSRAHSNLVMKPVTASTAYIALGRVVLFLNLTAQLLVAFRDDPTT